MAKHSPTTQVAFRLPDELLARLDRYVEHKAAEERIRTWNRAEAVRVLLDDALGRFEAGAKKGKR